MGGDKHGFAEICGIVNEVPKAAPRLRIDAGSGFVEKQNGWIVQHRAAQRQPLFETQRQIASEHIFLFLQPDLFDQRGFAIRN